MSEALALEIPAYEPPEGSADFGERDVEGKDLRLLLYIGEIASLDVVHLDENGEPEFLVMRLEDTRDRAMNLLRHPQSYISKEIAIQLFD